MEIITEDWYKLLVDNVDSAITEGEFNARMGVLETYHGVGRDLTSASKEHQIPITELVHRVAVDAEIGERNLWYAVKFFDKFPDLSKLPEGKDLSWSKIKRKYLTEAKKDGGEQLELIKAAPDAVKEAMFKHADELVAAAQYTADGILIFIPKDLLMK